MKQKPVKPAFLPRFMALLTTLLVTSIIIAILWLIFGGAPLLVSGQSGDSPPADYNASCEVDRSLYYYFGTYCLHPVYWSIPNYSPIGTALGFQNTETGQEDIGRVTTYYWDIPSQRYVYQLLWKPSPDPFQRRYALVAPENIIQLP